MIQLRRPLGIPGVVYRWQCIEGLWYQLAWVEGQYCGRSSGRPFAEMVDYWLRWYCGDAMRYYPA